MKSRVARLLLAGALAYAIGLLAPWVLTGSDFEILPLLHRALLEHDGTFLLASAWRLVALNTVRAAPVYLGSLLLAYGAGEWLAARGKQGYEKRLTHGLPVILVPAAYHLIEGLYGVTYDFGVPALLATSTIVYLHALSRHTQGPGTQAVILLTALASFQWLDVAPALSAHGFGRGELSSDVKLVAAVLGREGLLNEASFSMSVLLALMAVVVARWTVGVAKHLQLMERLSLERLEAQRARLEAVEGRATREVQFLVHDLKTPLTAAQGLVSLLRMQAEQGAWRGASMEHLRRVEGILDQMNRLISELLQEQVRRPVTADDILHAVRRQLAFSQPRPIRWRVQPGIPTVQANLPRLVRALVNLIDNACAAAGMAGTVEVSMGPLPRRSGMRIRVRDRGPGIPAWALEKVTEPGFSLTGGAGLGLAFVRHVVEDTHHGRFSLCSKPGCGTLAVIEIFAGAGDQSEGSVGGDG